MPINFYKKRKQDQKTEKEERYYQYQRNDAYHALRVYLTYDSPEYWATMGFWVMMRGNRGPFEKLSLKHFGCQEYRIPQWHFSEKEIQEFTEFLDAHNIKWL